MCVLWSCASGLTKNIYATDTGLTVSAALIPPVRIVGTDSPGWRRFELAQRQIAVGLRESGTRLAFFGPAQVQITRWEEPGWLGNNAVPLLTNAAVPLDQAVIIRTTAEQRQESSVHEREDSKGRKRGGAMSQETTWVLTLELIHPTSRKILAELSSSVLIDPFAQPSAEDEFDQAPALTRLLEALTKEALGIVKRWERERQPIDDVPLTLALSPAITASQPEAADAQTDALQAEIWMQARARFLSPWLTDEQAAKLAKAAPALFVGTAPEGASVRTGDLILGVDGEAPLPEVLARKRLSGLPVEVRVAQGGNERDAVIR